MRLFGREWFEANQLSMLFLANTRGGRRLLRISDDVPAGRSIVRIGPNSYTCLDESHPTFLHALWSMRKPREVSLISDFRCRPKFANRLEHSWVRNVVDWNQYVGYVWDCVGSPFRVRPAFALTLTAYPDPDPETATVDGYVQRNVAGTWGSVRDGAGTGAGPSAAFEEDAYVSATTITDQYGLMRRGIYLYDTSSLGSSATISASIMSTFGAAKSDLGGVLPTYNMYSSAPASNTNLDAGGADFTTIGATAYATAITFANFSTTGYNDLTMNSTGIDAISKTSISKFGTREATFDAANSAMPWASGRYVQFKGYFADQTGTANDPKLVVTYTVVTSIARNMLLLGVA